MKDDFEMKVDAGAHEPIIEDRWEFLFLKFPHASIDRLTLGTWVDLHQSEEL